MELFGKSIGVDGDDVADAGFASANFLGGNSDGGSSGSDRAGERDARGVEFDPEQHTGERKQDGTWARKRGRRAGSGGSSNSANRSKKTSNSASVDSLANMLGLLHIGIATATKTPELKLTDEETKRMAQATARVLEEFDVRPDPKVEALVGLIIACGSIYTPRVYFVRERLKKEALEKSEHQSTAFAS